MTKSDQLYALLVARGYSGNELKKQYTKLKKQGMSVDQLIQDFIRQADKDPNSVSVRNCSDGKCARCVNKF
ncbi:MAG: hypothetical protein LBS76_01120 [Mycoplasmataceae bacterium]|jgi:hypothetical protein|nr:hypothetical protein [Mycoplasmataceae bacterium]